MHPHIQFFTVLLPLLKLWVTLAEGKEIVALAVAPGTGESVQPCKAIDDPRVSHAIGPPI